MNVTVSNVLTIENPTQDALVWCKRNLVITNPEYAKKARMHFWLGNTPPTLTLYERRGDTLILPFGTLRNLPDCIAQESTFRSAFSDPVSVSYDTTVCKIDKSGEFVRMWEGYSATTMRHINAFIEMFGISGGGKKWWDALPVEEGPCAADMTPAESLKAMWAIRAANY